MKFHQTEYDFLFQAGAVRYVCPTNPLRKITIRPSHLDGFWHVERWNDGYVESTHQNRPMQKDGLTYFLKMWGFPAEKSAWEVIVEAEDLDDGGERALPKDMATLLSYRVVYFLKAGPFIKIGFTAGPLCVRIAQLKTGCPYDIQVLATIKGDYKTEHQLHKKFKKHRANLEWFRESDEILNFIREYAHAA